MDYTVNIYPYRVFVKTFHDAAKGIALLESMHMINAEILSGFCEIP